jgi:hypothetical protein
LNDLLGKIGFVMCAPILRDAAALAEAGSSGDASLVSADAVSIVIDEGAAGIGVGFAYQFATLHPYVGVYSSRELRDSPAGQGMA